MIDALIAGKLYGTVSQRTTKTGNPFATAKVRVTTVTGEGLFVNVIAFADAAVGALLALSDGDSVAISGELTPPRCGPIRPAKRGHLSTWSRMRS